MFLVLVAGLAISLGIMTVNVVFVGFFVFFFFCCCCDEDGWLTCIVMVNVVFGRCFWGFFVMIGSIGMLPINYEQICPTCEHGKTNLFVYFCICIY